jgi:NAD(P)-dependent dehydrogenase (short-subunit alcohol dehydrogenase family)
MAERALKGQLALVTGAGKRLGRAIALALGREGVSVVVHYRSSAREAEDTAKQLRAMKVDAWVLQADLGDSGRAAGLVEEAAALAVAPVDILVNSAGIFPANRVLSFSLDALDASLRVNALSPLMLARGLAAQEREGQIINMLDTRILEYDAEHAAYHLSKRMLFTITRMLALELAPTIRVNAVAPGLVLPPPGKDEYYLAKLARTTPLHTYGSAEDVVRAVVFLLHSEFVTGQVIYVDGGSHMKGATYGG